MSSKVFFFFLAFFFFSCRLKDMGGGKEKYFFPQNYIGVAYIIHHQNDGKSSKYVHGERIYDIPKTGILKTKFRRNLGFFPTDSLDNWFQFFYVNPVTKDTSRLLNHAYSLQNEKSIITDSTVVASFSLNSYYFIRDTFITFIILDTLKNLPKYHDVSTYQISDSTFRAILR